MKKIILCITVFCVLISAVGFTVGAADSSEIVILFESDVHCSVDGYTKLAALKEEMSASADYVGIVSSGDFIQGGNLGLVSKGEYIVNIMNIIGYDAVALGNHEFDYKTQRLHELAGMLDAVIVCANYRKTDTAEPVFEPYTIVSYGEVDVAYIGVITPDTITSSSPIQFKNDEGEYIYSFSGESLYETVQQSIDAAKNDGADYVIGLTHLGTEFVFEEWSAQTVIENTTGFDVVLDGHSHSVIPGMTLYDKSGKEVKLASTGYNLANVGKLTIADGKITTELISLADHGTTNAEVDSYVEKIKSEFSVLGERKVGVSEVELVISDENGKRLIRNNETNMGDICADAYRVMTGADIGMINGGGIRSGISVGDITFNELLSVFPYSNKTCVCEVSGQQVVDLIEYGLMFYPEENGTFQHVSGIKFDFDPTVEHSVRLSANQEFVSIDGARRVSNVKVLNGETGEYEPIRLDGTYTLASHSYLLMDHGGGAAMLNDAKLVSDTGILDAELLETYISEQLNGVVGREYAESQNRINVLDEYIPLRKTFEGMGCEVIWNEAEPMKIVVKTADCTVVFTAGTNTLTVDGEAFESDRAAYIEDGTTYISADCLAFCD